MNFDPATGCDECQKSSLAQAAGSALERAAVARKVDVMGIWSAEPPEADGWYWVLLYSEPTIGQIRHNPYRDNKREFSDSITGRSLLLKNTQVRMWGPKIEAPAPPSTCP